MCKSHPAQIPSEAKGVLEEAAPSEMDSHLLLDALTLSAVAILLITLLVAKLVKKQKKLASTQSSATQTTVWDTDIEKALTKMNEEMEEFHARLERMEQARLESINLRRLTGNHESQSKEDGAPASEQWCGASPSYPPYLSLIHISEPTRPY